MTALPVPCRPPIREVVMKVRTPASPLWRSRWVSVGFALVAAGLVPWVVVLQITLPASTEARHWSLAWAGFDCLLATAVAMTALFSRRHDTRAGLTAAATAALALVDAWFDVLTAAPGGELAQASVLAVCAELPLAALCVSIALSTHRSIVDAQAIATVRHLHPALATSADPSVAADLPAAASAEVLTAVAADLPAA